MPLYHMLMLRVSIVGTRHGGQLLFLYGKLIGLPIEVEPWISRYLLVGKGFFQGADCNCLREIIEVFLLVPKL